MKKIIIPVILAILVLIGTISIGRQVTYYDGKAILLENSKDIEILSNEVIINTTNSKISNEILLKNIGNSNVKTKVSIQLEDNVLSTKIKDLSIKTNGAKVKYEKGENGVYIFDIEIPKKEGKKIEIEYTTDNNLSDARIIKYNIDNLKINDKRIGKLKVDIVINEIDIPLVKKIYPMHYTFDLDSKTITVEYTNFKVNNLTKDIIIEKDTIKDILSQENVAKEDKYIAENAQKWIDEGIDIDYNKYIPVYNGVQNALEDYNILEDLLKKDLQISDSEYSNLKDRKLDDIFTYAIYKQVVKDNKLQSWSTYSEGYSSELFNSLPDFEGKYISKVFEESNIFLEDKIICISYEKIPKYDFLYLYEDNFIEYEVDGYLQFENKKIEKQARQEEILKIEHKSVEYIFRDYSLKCKIINIGQGINGEFIDASLEDKIEYAQMINADVHIIRKLYDTNKSYDEIENTISIEYYGNENESMFRDTFIISEDKFNNENNYYVGYEEYIKEQETYLKQNVQKVNDEKLKNAKIPTFISYCGYIYNENGKKFVEHTSDVKDTLYSIRYITDTKRAQDLIKQNKEDKSKIKKEIENEIANLVLTPDKEVIGNELSIVNHKIQKNSIIIYINIAGIAVCVIILLIKFIKRKIGGKKNGKHGK